MSTFHGRLLEFPSIAADNFTTRDGVALYLLSHCHTDHLRGLVEPLPAPLICSVATASILPSLRVKTRHRSRPKSAIEDETAEEVLADVGNSEGRLCGEEHDAAIMNQEPRFGWLRGNANLRPLNLEEPTEVNLGDGNTVTITLLPANHCPGSCMFLIEGRSKTASQIKGSHARQEKLVRVLYTGDFRPTETVINHLSESAFLFPQALTSSLGSQPNSSDISARIDTVYLDTTFFSERYAYFPPKDKSIAAVVELVQSLPPDAVISLESRCMGYEEVWVAVAHALGSKIHMPMSRAILYEAAARSSEPETSLPFHSYNTTIRAFNTVAQFAVTGRAESFTSRVHACETWCGACKRADNLGKLWVVRMGGAPGWRAGARDICVVRSENGAFESWKRKGVGSSCRRVHALFSMHASKSEITAFVALLRPQRVYGCVGGSSVPGLEEFLANVDEDTYCESATTAKAPDRLDSRIAGSTIKLGHSPPRVESAASELARMISWDPMVEEDLDAKDADCTIEIDDTICYGPAQILDSDAAITEKDFPGPQKGRSPSADPSDCLGAGTPDCLLEMMSVGSDVEVVDEYVESGLLSDCSDVLGQSESETESTEIAASFAAMHCRTSTPVLPPASPPVLPTTLPTSDPDALIGKDSQPTPRGEQDPFASADMTVYAPEGSGDVTVFAPETDDDEPMPQSKLFGSSRGKVRRRGVSPIDVGSSDGESADSAPRGVKRRRSRRDLDPGAAGASPAEQIDSGSEQDERKIFVARGTCAPQPP
ncbi:hypothetical protein DFJ73DRAFT_815911 [Zopfochytrium polystomum]|nr:hypothetical protein DFJ73DRAFT_815911 [Zopfochytrium polystomum]